MNKYSIGPTIEVDGAPRICINESGFGTVALFNVADDYASATYEQDEKADIEKADFFVRAANNHDALVDLLRDISGTMQQHDPMKERIITALAAATA